MNNKNRDNWFIGLANRMDRRHRKLNKKMGPLNRATGAIETIGIYNRKASRLIKYFSSWEDRDVE